MQGNLITYYFARLLIRVGCDVPTRMCIITFLYAANVTNVSVIVVK